VEIFSFPALYRRWFSELPEASPPAETRADCRECPMCSQPEPPAEGDRWFKQGLRCCMYMPTLPNFLVGAVLQDDSPGFAPAREQFEREAVKAFVTPTGVSPPWYWLVLCKLKPFGRFEGLLCPFSIRMAGEVACGIWPYRNSECTTWFCKYERRAVGYRFWRQAKRLLRLIEDTLARWCSEQLDAGTFQGREREFYKDCFRLVDSLSFAEVLEHCGEAAAVEKRKLLDAHARFSDMRVPESLQAGPFRSERLSDGNVRIWAYSNYDPIDLPPGIMDLLPDRWREMEPSLLSLLLDAEILIAPEPDAGS
jgi:hypothetical protein